MKQEKTLDLLLNSLGDFCDTMIGRADIEESKSNVAMNAWLPQASYPCGNFSDTSVLYLDYCIPFNRLIPISID